MNDPHVEKLYYRFISEDPNVHFDNAQSSNLTLGSFDVEIKDSILVAIPHDHYPSEESAKRVFEPMLRSWESSAFLSSGKMRIRFKFDKADVVDRKPTSGRTTVLLNTAGSIELAGKLTAILHSSKYPEPDLNFVASALTDELIFRLQQYKDGRQTLPHVAYYILERLEEELVISKVKDTRKELSRILYVEHKVLDNVGKFSNKPDAKIGRHASRLDVPLTNKELLWLEEAVFRLVKRAGEINGGSKFPIIQMADLPML